MIVKRITAWMLAACCAGLAAVAGAQPKSVELEFPSWQLEEPGNAEYWTELIKAFEAKNPNVRIKKQQVPFREYIDKMTVRFAGNNPPDIVHLPTRNYLAFASQGWLAPLDEYLAQTDVKQTYMKLNDEMVYNGKSYGVLMMGYGMMFFYNEKLLADAKVGRAEDQRRAAQGDRGGDRCQRRPLRLRRADQRASERLCRDLDVGDRRGGQPLQGTASTTSPTPP